MSSASCAPEIESYNDCVLQKLKPGLHELAVWIISRACREKFTLAAMSPQAVDNLSGALKIHESRATGNIYNGNADWTVKELTVVVGWKLLQLFNERQAILDHSYHINVDLPPLAEVSIAFRIDESSKAEESRGDWFIYNAEGLKD